MRDSEGLAVIHCLRGEGGGVGVCRNCDHLPASIPSKSYVIPKNPSTPMCMYSV